MQIELIVCPGSAQISPLHPVMRQLFGCTTPGEVSPGFSADGGCDVAQPANKMPRASIPNKKLRDICIVFKTKILLIQDMTEHCRKSVQALLYRRAVVEFKVCRNSAVAA